MKYLMHLKNMSNSLKTKLSKDSPIVQFFTVESRFKNVFSKYPKMIRIYFGRYKFLPTAKYIYHREKTDFPLPTESLKDFVYTGSPTEEQSHINNIIERRIREYWYGCWLIVMWTGKGKSHTIMQTVNLLRQKTLILCHNQKTLLEMREKFKEFTNYTPWVYFSLEKEIKDITITTHSSYVSMAAKDPENSIFNTFDCIMYDEADYSVSDKMFKALAFSNASFIYGLTGTPYTKDLSTEWMEKIYGKRIIFEWGEKYNIVPSIIECYRYKAHDQYEYTNWAELQECLFNNEERLNYMIDIVKRHYEGRNWCIILFNRIEEINIFSKMLQKVKIKHKIITWQTKPVEDNEVIKEISDKKSRSFNIIIGSIGKLARWVDIPIIDTIFMFAPTYFEGTIVQAVGRALRNHPEKEIVKIIDFSDDECAKQRYQRLKAYKQEYGLTESSIIIHKPIKNVSKLRL